MTQQKSFKSRIRERMDKTGESYTTARLHLINKADVNENGQADTVPETPAAIASGQRISDEALARRTGRFWEEWFELLDEWGGTNHTHAEIARWLVADHEVDGWWAQTVTVGYEQARGMRKPGQSSDGKFSASASKTVNVPVERLYDAFADESMRQQWLPDANVTERTSTSPKTYRADWEDGTTRIAVWFTSKDETKSQVAVQHEKLADGDEAAVWKAYWRERLNVLKKVLEG